MFLSILLISAAAATPTPPVTARTEMLGIDVPDEFEIGYHARNDTSEILELVHPPETVETWSKLITSQMFFDGARNGSIHLFYSRWREGLREACAGMTDVTIKGSVDGMDALRSTLSCPKNPQTGKPENLEAVLVQGSANMMMVQVAFRRPITDEDTALIRRVTGSLKVCDERSLAQCSARTATGFLPAN